MSDPIPSNPQLIVDLGALKRNYRTLQTFVQSEVGAVVKADAYGLGMKPIVEALAGEGCRTFFAAYASEGAQIRAIAPDVEIFIFAPFVEIDAEVLFDNALKPCLYDINQARAFVASAEERGRVPQAALHVETGINRLGMSRRAVEAFLSDPSLKAVQIDLLMGHLACADDPESAQNESQLEAFRFFHRLLPGIRASLANSAGVFLGPLYHFDLVRPGIALYGHDPHFERVEPRVEPVATLQARVGQIKTVEPGQSIGYGATVTCTAPTRVGVVLAGYADGIMRRLGNDGPEGPQTVAINGRRAPIFGRVSMDLITVDLSGFAPDEVTPGARVEIFGREVRVEELARRARTIPYEIFTQIGSRVPRVYLDPEDRQAAPIHEISNGVEPR